MMESKYGDLFTTDMIIQLNTVFDKMDRELVLRFYPDLRPVSDELLRYLTALSEMCAKLKLLEEPAADEEGRPCVRVFYTDGTDAGIAYHGVPGGHEFTPFLLGLYNASGPGQPINDRDRKDILALDKEIRMKIMVSLNCTICPELVTAALRIASLNEHVSVDVYDLNHFAAMREQYEVMSVPCYVINDGPLQFGKKSLPALLEQFMNQDDNGREVVS